MFKKRWKKAETPENQDAHKAVPESEQEPDREAFAEADLSASIRIALEKNTGISFQEGLLGFAHTENQHRIECACRMGTRTVHKFFVYGTAADLLEILLVVQKDMAYRSDQAIWPDLAVRNPEDGEWKVLMYPYAILEELKHRRASGAEKIDFGH